MLKPFLIVEKKLFAFYIHANLNQEKWLEGLGNFCRILIAFEGRNHSLGDEWCINPSSISLNRSQIECIPGHERTSSPSSPSQVHYQTGHFIVRLPFQRVID